MNFITEDRIFKEERPKEDIKEGEMARSKRTKENTIFLFVIIGLVLFYANSSDSLLISGISNLAFSVILSLVLLVFWFLMTK